MSIVRLLCASHLVARSLVTWSALGLLVLSGPLAAQQVARVNGVTVNLGIVPAEVALRADGHRDMHPPHPPPGSQHVLVTLEDEQHKRIDDADVTVEVTDPRKHVEKKPLLHTQAGGMPDYSELFVFNWSGDYALRVIVAPKAGAKSFEARFTVHHAV
jgi:hypothetical protein